MLRNGRDSVWERERERERDERCEREEMKGEMWERRDDISWVKNKRIWSLGFGV
jgi:hypothetical protein